MATMLDYRVVVCDPRIEYHEDWRGDRQVERSREMPDDVVLAMHPDGNSAVVAVTHDSKFLLGFAWAVHAKADFSWAESLRFRSLALV